MLKIDFYLLTTSNDKDRLLFVCRLVEKIYKQQHRIYIHAENQTIAHQVDELLWTYREDSFLPHNLYGEGPDPAPPIQIGYNVAPEKQRDILINLNSTAPEFYKQFARVLEIISNDTTAQAVARERYKFYRAEGNDITTHKLKTSTEV
jgi:DNA polymerase-3 subunit chi